MAENRRRGSAPDKEALAALGTAAPSRLRKAAPSDVVSELASQPAPAAVQPAAAPARRQPPGSTVQADRSTSVRVSPRGANIPGAWFGITRMRPASMPWATQSAAVTADGTTTTSASSRAIASARRKNALPRGVKWLGSRRNARSCTVTTSGALPRGIAQVVACTTSRCRREASPRRPRGRPRDQSSYSTARGSGE